MRCEPFVVHCNAGNECRAEPTATEITFTASVAGTVLMKPPIFIDDSGDLLVFETISKVEQYVEPIDVAREGLLAFDSEGRSLRLLVLATRKHRTRVQLESVDDEPRHQSELRKIIIGFLCRVGQSREELEPCALTQLVEKALPFEID